MLKFKRKSGVHYYHNSIFRVKPESRRSANSTLREMSVKARRRVSDYRSCAIAYWGAKCFLCGREYTPNKNGKYVGLDIHHITGRKNGDNIMNMVPLCSRTSGCRAHNHNGCDARFYELQSQINKKMEETNGRNNTN